MKINFPFKPQYDGMLKRIQEAKSEGLKVKTYLFKDAEIYLALIKDKEGEVIQPIISLDFDNSLESTEDAMRAGMYVLIMALAAEGAEDVLDHPKFEKCVRAALDRIPVFAGLEELMKKLAEHSFEDEDLN